MQNWKYLQFFDKNGRNYNFEYDETLNKWSGNIFLPQVSVGLFEVGQLFIVQELIDVTNNSKQFAFPHQLDNVNSSSNGWLVDWAEEDPTEFMLFQFNKNFDTGTQTSLEQEPDGPPIEIYDNIQIDLDYDPSQTVDSNGYIVTSMLTSEAIEINFAIRSETSNTYRRTLVIRDNISGDIIAELIDIPAALIMRLVKSDIEVFVSSQT